MSRVDIQLVNRFLDSLSSAGARAKSAVLGEIASRLTIGEVHKLRKYAEMHTAEITD